MNYENESTAVKDWLSALTQALEDQSLSEIVNNEEIKPFSDYKELVNHKDYRSMINGKNIENKYDFIFYVLKEKLNPNDIIALTIGSIMSDPDCLRTSDSLITSLSDYRKRFESTKFEGLYEHLKKALAGVSDPVTVEKVVESSMITVTFKFHDHIESKRLMFSEIPSVPIEEKCSDNSGNYIFKGWNKPVESATADETYIADYEFIPRAPQTPKPEVPAKSSKQVPNKNTDLPRSTRQVPNINKFTRFEKARIIGARALQISYGAPVLVDYPDDMLDPIDIAMLEFDKDLIPISVLKN